MAAALLDAPWHDLDAAVTARLGATIPTIFAERGEAEFRRHEQEALLDLLTGPASVIATGGGWVAHPGNFEALAGRALTLYLSVPLEVAAGRLGTASDRPLLTGAVLPRLRQLLIAREACYRRADLEIDAQASPDRVAAAVAVAARQSAGWQVVGM